MQPADKIALIAALTLSALILGTLVLPLIAALAHVPYEINSTVVTGSIAALSGIISAVTVKKINDTNKPQ
jgi:uncharacterized membrane protein